MHLALVGNGQMASIVDRLAKNRGHTIDARFDTRHPLVEASSLEGIDVVIDFSHASGVATTLGCCAQAEVPLVIGTTGWDTDSLGATGAPTSVVYAPNFSIGAALLRVAVGAVLPLLNRLDEFDVAIHEMHHTRKRDKPSGTALDLAKAVVEGLGTAPTVTATRLGNVFGTHQVYVDGPTDRLLLQHEALSRDGFALGAVLAAEWVPGRKGHFTIGDLIDDLTAGFAVDKELHHQSQG